MSDQVQISTLSALSDDSTLTAGAIITHTEHNTHRTNYRALINNLLKVAQDLENSYSGTSNPNDDVQGKHWMDTTNTRMTYYKSSSYVNLLEAGDNGTDDFQTGGKILIDVDGTALNAAGSITFGAGQDGGIYHDGTDLIIITDGAGGGGIKFDSEDDTHEWLGSGVSQATLDGTALDILTKNFRTGGMFLIDVDGTALNAAGSVTLGAGQDAGMYFDGTDLVIMTDGAGAGGIIFDSEDDTYEWKISGTKVMEVVSTGELKLTYAGYFATQTLTDGANISWNLRTNQVAQVTLEGNRTLDNPTNQLDGGCYILEVIQDGTGSRTLSYGSEYDWPAGTAPVLTTTASATDVIVFISNGSNMRGVAQLAFS